jgi:hypothetical protein
MGIDVYLGWPGKTEDDQKAQYTGYSIVHGHVGYLREGGGRSPSAIKVMFPAAWSANGEPVVEPASGMRERLPTALAAVAQRYADEPDIIHDAQKSFIDFVDLAEHKERETGEPCTVAVR